MSESEIVSHSVESDSLQHHGPQPISLLSPWDFLGKNTEVGCHSLLQMIFPTQGLNRDLLHCGQILYSLSHQGSPGASWADHKSKKKNLHFEVSSSLILCNNTKPFLNQIVVCNKKWVIYNNQQQPAWWLDQEEAPKHFPKSNLQ